jgi:hypothetical protein
MSKIYYDNEVLNKLKEKVNGKRIEIKEGFGEACLFMIILDNGEAFSLHANDLGFWMKEFKADVGNKKIFQFETLKELMREIADYILEYKDYEYKINNTLIKKDDNYLSIVFEDVIFKCKMFHPWEQKILKSKYFTELLRESITVFNLGVFDYPTNYIDECDEDLSIPKDYF